MTVTVTVMVVVAVEEVVIDRRLLLIARVLILCCSPGYIFSSFYLLLDSTHQVSPLFICVLETSLISNELSDAISHHKL